MPLKGRGHVTCHAAAQIEVAVRTTRGNRFAAAVPVHRVLTALLHTQVDADVVLLVVPKVPRGTREGGVDVVSLLSVCRMVLLFTDLVFDRHIDVCLHVIFGVNQVQSAVS